MKLWASSPDSWCLKPQEQVGSRGETVIQRKEGQSESSEAPVLGGPAKETLRAARRMAVLNGSEERASRREGATLTDAFGRGSKMRAENTAVWRSLVRRQGPGAGVQGTGLEGKERQQDR